MKEDVLVPSVEEWKELYEAAVDFKDLRPWLWMVDSDLIGVQNPQDKEIGYCCIMGQMGQVFALVVYVGSEGLDAYLKIQSGEIDGSDPEFMHTQKCLIASFENRGCLEKEDFQIIKKLGLKFRGPNAWPQFRSYLPGYVPWFLTKNEARFLTIALKQSMDVALRFRKDKKLLPPPDSRLIMARIPGGKGEKTDWKDVLVELPAQGKKEDILIEPVNELRIERVKKNLAKREGIWEVDFFYFPGAVQEGDRPYFPRTLVIVDHSIGIVLHTWLASPWKFFSEYQEDLLSFIEAKETLPKQILVSKHESFTMLAPITSGLNIDLKMVKALRALEEFKEDMYAHFRGTP